MKRPVMGACKAESPGQIVRVDEQLIGGDVTVGKASNMTL